MLGEQGRLDGAGTRGGADDGQIEMPNQIFGRLQGLVHPVPQNRQANPAAEGQEDHDSGVLGPPVFNAGDFRLTHRLNARRPLHLHLDVLDPAKDLIVKSLVHPQRELHI
jgi:hypothetical protein